MYHVGCGGNIIINISKAYEVWAVQCSVNGKTGKLRVNRVKIDKKQSSIKRNEFSFMCTRCGEKIKDLIKECAISCIDCGDMFSLDNLYIPKDSGGVYCKRCSKHFRDTIDNIDTLLDILDLSAITL